MKMNTKKRIEQLIEEILIEIDLQRECIDIVDSFQEGNYYGMISASGIVARIGSKYLKEEEGT